MQGENWTDRNGCKEEKNSEAFYRVDALLPEVLGSLCGLFWPFRHGLLSLSCSRNSWFSVGASLLRPELPCLSQSVKAKLPFFYRVRQLSRPGWSLPASGPKWPGRRPPSPRPARAVRNERCEEDREGFTNWRWLSFSSPPILLFRSGKEGRLSPPLSLPLLL